MMIPTSTSAVILREHGGPEKLRYEKTPLPELGPTDVLVAVEVASVSGFDLLYRRGRPTKALPGRAPFPLPQQLGREAAGHVLAVGEHVERFHPGDRVVAVVHPENPDSPEAGRGLGNLSTGLDIPGHQAPGGYARHLVRDQKLWFPLPDGVDTEQAAVTLWSYSTSHRLLTSRFGVALGDTLLICGATGAMGMATLGLAKLMGVRVLAVTRHAAKIDGLRSAGADHVTVLPDTAAEHVGAAVHELREFTGGEGVDHALDYTGNSVLLRLLVDALRLGGHVCFAGGWQGTPGPLPITGFDMNRLEATVVGIRGAQRRDALTVLTLLARGDLHTPIAARFPLEQAADAHRLLEDNTDLVGRVTLHPSSNT